MNFLQKIARLFSGSTPAQSRAYFLHVRCRRCGEEITSRIDLFNDLTSDYDDNRVTYFCHKTIMGEKCFQRIEVELRFDDKRRLIEQQITGGNFIENTAPL